MIDRKQQIDRRARGAGVEAAARGYLLRAGLRDVAANAAYRRGEIDLVMFDDGRSDEGRLDEGRLDEARPAARARDGGTLVFIEVRYRNDPRFGGGAASIDARKRRKLVHAAQAFLHAHREFATAACRFDVIDASGDPERPDIVWLRDAFRADDV